MIDAANSFGRQQQSMRSLADAFPQARWERAMTLTDSELNPTSVEAVFIGGNAVRAIGVIAALEEDLRRPVPTANQVSLWYALRVAGAQVSVDDYGRLFNQPYDLQ